MPPVLSVGADPADLNDDGVVNALDIDTLSIAIGVGASATTYGYMDLNTDGQIDQADLDELVLNLVPTTGGGTGTFYGDANLDGAVDLLDFDILTGNFGSSGIGWAGGDFTRQNLSPTNPPDFTVDLLDFDILTANFGAGSPAAVPEPASAALLGLAGLTLLRRRHA
ncbi:MAG: dockerin type I domain-containing protein [Planctomycetota bacterium]